MKYIGCLADSTALIGFVPTGEGVGNPRETMCGAGIGGYGSRNSIGGMAVTSREIPQSRNRVHAQGIYARARVTNATLFA